MIRINTKHTSSSRTYKGRGRCKGWWPPPNPPLSLKEKKNDFLKNMTFTPDIFAPILGQGIPPTQTVVTCASTIDYLIRAETWTYHLSDDKQMSYVMCHPCNNKWGLIFKKLKRIVDLPIFIPLIFNLPFA